MEKQAHKKFGHFSWKIQNFLSLDCEKCYSAPVLIGDCKWRLFTYPKAKNNSDHLPLYLEVVDFESLPCGWGRSVNLRLTLVNKHSQDLSIVKGLEHCFDSKSTSCGFYSMLSFSQLHKEDSGFLVNGDVMIFAELDVIEVVGPLDETEKPEETSEILSNKEDNKGAESSCLVKKTLSVNQSNEISMTKYLSFITSMEKPVVGKKFVWVIENFSFSPSEMIYSDPFVLGGFEWGLCSECDLLFFYLYMDITDCESVPSGVVRLRIVTESFSKSCDLVHNADKPYRSAQLKLPFRFFRNVGGYLVNGELMVVAEVINGASNVYEESVSMYMKNPLQVNGFHVLPSQGESVRRIFERHPDIALEFRAKNQHMKTIYMNFLLSLIETLYQPLQELLKEDLVEADTALTCLKNVGFKVDWLEKKLEQLKERKERELSCEARIEKLELQLHVLKLTLQTEKVELSATRALLCFDDVV